MDQYCTASQAYIIHKELEMLAEQIAQQLSDNFPALANEHNFKAHGIYATQPTQEVLDIQPNYYQHLIDDLALSREERLVLALALSVHVAPHLLGVLLATESYLGGVISLLGGYRSTQYGRFIPTFQTAFFLLGGASTQVRVAYNYLLEPSHVFFKKGILKYPSEDIVTDSFLELTPEYQSLLVHSQAYEPQYSARFPAQKISTSLTWDDLVLGKDALEEVKEIEYWVAHQDEIMDEWQLNRHLHKGYKAVFYGASGTGKTLTTTLLGKTTGLPVYRTDTSALVSKYVGETGKNLENLFSAAENKNWILFFDEAESLFAKRGTIKDASDQYANQTITYLLQRIEDYNGVVILATNKLSSIDNAFRRRFQNIIKFEKPNRQQRLRLWQQAFQGNLQLSSEVDLEFIAQHYDEVTGGILVNILRDCAIRVAQRQEGNMVLWNDVYYSLRKQYRKHQYVWKDPIQYGLMG